MYVCMYADTPFTFEFTKAGDLFLCFIHLTGQPKAFLYQYIKFTPFFLSAA